ncbi:SET domain-containing protein 4 isoform X2 [Halichoeres trimaculatus]|uniref:SET domain-containing protein 4 isoform X2 n=1 Tax=Halichoeres trimaculatus TaxID=147232 RepID=UPI003D9EDB69
MRGGRHRPGRTARKRLKQQNSVKSVSLCHQQQYVKLMKFLHKHGFTSKLLQPALFTDTGRGLQALKTIKSDQLLISLPESCLLTTTTVLNSYLGPYIKSWKPKLSPLLALCVFLVCERYRGEASRWFPYINVLPTSYTCPAYFTDEVMAVLPASIKKKALDQREAVQEIHSLNLEFFRSLQPLLSVPVEEVLTYEALRWAWCSVNTRSVFMSHPSNNFLFGQDIYALAPFLDLLNHRPNVQQAFINYGSHDNQRLMMEYGFVAAENPHSVVYVDTDLLCDVLKGDRSLDHKIKFLRDNDFLCNLTLSSEGPSWRLMTALRLLSLPQTLYHQWRAVLLGQAVSEDREEWSLQTARTLCQCLVQDTHRALGKISILLQQCDQMTREQLEVVRALRQEERCILESCLNGILKTKDGLLPFPPDANIVS